MSPESSNLIRKGLWENNPALVQLLGLCPLLAVTSTVVNAVGLGLATLFVLCASNLLVSLIRHQVNEAVRLPAFVLIIASLVTCTELLMQAFVFELFEILGIFIPLIVTNCAILGRADAFASRNPPLPALLDGFMMGLGFAAVLVLLGAMRELIGQGTLLSDMHLLFGDLARNWTLTLSADYPGFLFAVLPPGAFFGMGLLIALKNYLDQQRKPLRQTDTATRPTRVRVTG